METIFGLSTIMGKSGVAVIRISGDGCLPALASLGIGKLEPRKAALCNLQFEGEIIDKAIVIYFKSPASFTGEDVVEIFPHGSIAVINKIIAALGKINNFRMAKPGEFSRRAFENNKMDLTEAEGLADLIEAETEAQHKQALRQMQGELGRIYDEWRVNLISLLANIEAYIDFPDEDLPQELKDKINYQIENLCAEISDHLDDNHRGEKIRNGLYAVILGAPNVGKSSLLNFLAKRDAAIVSDIAGTTRDVIEVSMEIAGLPVTFADTAGIRAASDEIESEGVRRALARAEDAALKIVMLDTTNIDAESLKLIDEKTIVIINKSDLANQQPDLPQNIQQISISLLGKNNLQEMLSILEKEISSRYALTESPSITRARHREALIKAIEALAKFSLDKPIELIAEDLRYAANAIGQITGKIDVEDILDKIFSSFCIGK